MTHQLPDGYVLRAGRLEDIPALQDVDIAASSLFEPTGLIDEPDGPVPIPEDPLRKGAEAGWLFVITDPFATPVGFALCREIKPDLYLDQISVAPTHGRRGLGGVLLNALFEKADNEGLKGVILSTFRDLAWNGPYYARFGFVEIPRKSMKKWMKDLEAIQSQSMDVSLRCFMRRPGKWDRHWIRPQTKPKLEAT